MPGLRQVLRGNAVRLGATARANFDLTWQSPDLIADAEGWMTALGIDGVIADHEPFVGRAARRMGLPVVALSHQMVLTEARPDIPLRYAASAWGTRVGIGILNPPYDWAVAPSFFFPPLRPGAKATLVPPILRDDVLALRATPGNRVLVYLNEGDGMAPLLNALDSVPADVYGLDPSLTAPAGVCLKDPSRPGFLADLAECRAVVATAGFTLLSEALHLGKPVLAVPNKGFFEQAVNALALADMNRGEWVPDLTEGDLAAFLDRADRYRQPQGSLTEGLRGREEAADAIERVVGVHAAAAG